ncbi:MAG: peptide chain release factor N(5)-glutamine methyltransferase [Candidatus Omnitrophica bacterium]|nr:peptide chain release factor N(5)-glutamine methyltransferase [Candidatus Omnitrophota bacterium]
MTARELILTHILRCSRADLYIKGLHLNETQQKIYDGIIRRIEAGEPLQYALGECEFMGHSLKVDSRVLIPRPETELLVEIIVETLQTSEIFKSSRVGLDIGVGSGNITIGLLRSLAPLHMTGLDVSMPALDLCRENLRRHDLEGSVNLIHGDVFVWLGQKYSDALKFSFMVSNPPYIKRANLELLPADVKREPVLALDGGEDGLNFYVHIISHVAHLLKPGGWIFFEIGEDQGKSLDNLLTMHGSFVNISIIKDYNQKDRFVKAQLIL